ncbi:MAG: hypothetical protein COA74_02310 [Gammaproteobacteria bacterium]|nr:MAG: hypothetical protein COA74_02310 [Gammaproteobacteria bacterium]
MNDRLCSKNTTSPDIIILGNSISGLSLAYSLIKESPDLNIVVVGPKGRKGSATTAAGAMINAFGELTLNQLSFPAFRERFELAANAMPLWDNLCAELSEYSDRPFNIKWGSYVISNAKGRDGEKHVLQYINKISSEYKYESSIIDPDSIKWYSPAPDAVSNQIISIPDGRVNPHEVLAAYECALTALGVKLIDDKASQFKIAETSVKHQVYISEHKQWLAAEKIVFANGTFAQQLIDQAPVLQKQTPRLLWGAGSALRITFPDWIHQYGGLEPNIFNMDKVIRTIDRGGACGLHVVPRDDGSFYVGASSGVWMEPEDKPRLHAINGISHAVIDEISKAFFYGTIELIGNGFRPVTVDCFPLIGESDISGIWFSNGFKRDGFTCSASVSPKLAKAILGQKNELPEIFKPSRKLISYKSKDIAISEAAVNHAAGDMMHGLHVPSFAYDSYIQNKQISISKIYQQRNIEDFGIHPEVLHFYENDEFFTKINHPKGKAIYADS